MTQIRIATIADPDAEVAVFMQKDGSAEAVICHPDRPTQPTRIAIPKPPKGMNVVMTRYPRRGGVEIVYRSLP